MAEKNKTIKWPCMTFLCMNALIVHTFLPLFGNTNGHLCQEILLKSRNFATMVTWRHTSLFRPFAASHSQSRGTKPPRWRTRNTLGLKTQRARIYFLCSSSLSVFLILQQSGVLPHEWLASKSLMDIRKDFPIKPFWTRVRTLLTPLLSVVLMCRRALG